MAIGPFSTTAEAGGGYRVEATGSDLAPIPELGIKKTLTLIGLAAADVGLGLVTLFHFHEAVGAAAFLGLPAPELVAAALPLLTLVVTPLCLAVMAFKEHRGGVVTETRDVEAGRRW